MKQPLMILPEDIERDFGSYLDRKGIPAAVKGHFALVAAKRTEGGSALGQRITVLVIDEEGDPMPSAPVAFGFSTAGRFWLRSEFLWAPTWGRNALIVSTRGSGEIDLVLGRQGVIEKGGAGGVTVYVFDPEYSSDAVIGAGMLPDHTGLYLTFQRQPKGYKSKEDAIDELRASVEEIMQRIDAQQAQIDALEQGLHRVEF